MVPSSAFQPCPSWHSDPCPLFTLPTFWHTPSRPLSRNPRTAKRPLPRHAPARHSLTMSATTAISSHTRSKSLRVPASDSSFLKRPAPAPQSSLVQQSGPSHISLFLMNLRLLDLDKREDWPGITPITFTTKDSQQNIKKRIQCVEWALFRLFELWDPEEAREVGGFGDC